MEYSWMYNTVRCTQSRKFYLDNNLRSVIEEFNPCPADRAPTKLCRKSVKSCIVTASGEIFPSIMIDGYSPSKSKVVTYRWNPMTGSRTRLHIFLFHPFQKLPCLGIESFSWWYAQRTRKGHWSVGSWHRLSPRCWLVDLESLSISNATLWTRPIDSSTSSPIPCPFDSMNPIGSFLGVLRRRLDGFLHTLHLLSLA